MIFQGIIQVILPEKSGVSQKSGKEWRTQEFVVKNIEGKYPETMVFSVFNKDIGAVEGDEVDVRFEGNAREYNGRWYNDLRAFEVTVISSKAPRAQMPSQPVPPQPQIFDQQILEEKNDELPF